MWAVIGVHCGRENNIFWKRIKGDKQGRIEAAAAQSIGTGEAVSLGRGIIHSVTNPSNQLTAALHVYGGDFFASERSEWDALNLEEKAYGVEKNMALFERG